MERLIGMQKMKKVIKKIPKINYILNHFNLCNYYFKNLIKKPVVNSPPWIFNIELTNNCPMKCIMCARTYNMTRDKGFMNFNVFKKAIDELIEVNPEYVAQNERLWLHHFGESLLHPEFDKFINYASSKKIYVCLSLNPIMLTEENALKLIYSKPALIYLSLDGHDDASFFKIRGMKNAYTKSKENVLRFLELKKHYKSDIQIMLSMINFQENFESIEKARSFWEKQDSLNGLLIKKFVSWDGSVEQINSLEAIDKHNNKKTKTKNQIVTCNFPWRAMTILWDGDVVPCCFDYDKKYALGNIKNNTLLEIWNSNKMVSLRKEFISSDVNNQLCRNCNDLRNIPEIEF